MAVAVGNLYATSRDSRRKIPLTMRVTCDQRALHSHPNGAAVPSGADRHHAWPGYLQVIYPVHEGIPGTPRGWFFHGGELSPIELETP